MSKTAERIHHFNSAKNPFIQPFSNKLVLPNTLPLPPIPLVLPIQRLHRRAHAAHRRLTCALAGVRTLARSLREQRRVAHVLRVREAMMRVLLLLLLVVGQDERLSGDVGGGRGLGERLAGGRGGLGERLAGGVEAGRVGFERRDAVRARVGCVIGCGRRDARAGACRGFICGWRDGAGWGEGLG